ncbi:MAG: peptidoglycan bridge formation glycyltransferase FemA/FemB family protein [Bacilli bacterium]|nr:peptidoglycan bridge formation glycyltransferase FemA/FemB family protein [Bacilli bacterium]
MKLEEISLNEYEEFINSLGIKNTLIRMNNRSYIGIKENDKIIGVDMIGTAKRKTFGKYAYYSAIGPIFNKDDKELIDFYINNIKEYVKNHDGYVFILGEEIANKYNLEKEYPITRHYKLMKIFESIR